jgi:glycosyltransferase involved in cell wall biosynthesis
LKNSVKYNPIVISIITINYNNLNGLRKTVESVIQQSYKSFEYIVIDGNSNDGSKEYLLSLKKEFAYFISETDSGIYNAMNKGLKQAKGQYLLFLNSGDCIAEKNSLEKIYPFLKPDVINYSDVYLNENGSLRLHNSLKPVTKQSYFKSYLHHQAIIYPNKLIIPYDESFNYASDWLLNYTLLTKKIPFHYFALPFIIYDTTGLTSKGETVNKTLKEKRRMKVLKFPFALWQQNGYSIKMFLIILKEYLQYKFTSPY